MALFAAESASGTESDLRSSLVSISNAASKQQYREHPRQTSSALCGLPDISQNGTRAAVISIIEKSWPLRQALSSMKYS
jgi:hypothetical protein